MSANGAVGTLKRLIEEPFGPIKSARNEKADSPLHFPALSSDEEIIPEALVNHVVKLRLHFLDSIENPKMLQDWQWTILSKLLEGSKVRQDIPKQRILLLNAETLQCFRTNNRVHFGRLAAFLQLIRNPKFPAPIRQWSFLDPTPFTPEERAEAVVRADIRLWRPSLLGFVEGDVTIKSGRYTAIGFRQILKGCQVFENILADHPEKQVLPMVGIEPFLLSTAYIWSYCKPFPEMMNKVKNEKPIPPPKDPSAILKNTPKWLQEATDATWWGQFFAQYAPDRVLNCIPIAAQHPNPSIRSGCEEWANELFKNLLADLTKRGTELEQVFYKVARAVTQLDVTPSNHFTLDRIRLWCPHLVTLSLQLSEGLNNRNEKTFHFPNLLQLELRFLPATKSPIILDCLSGCPRLEKLKVDGMDASPKLLCRFQKPGPFLTELRTLELANIYLEEPSDSQRLFRRISGMAELEELTLSNIEGLTAEDIRQLKPLKSLKVLKIFFDLSWCFNEEMIQAVADLSSLAHVELDSLNDQHYDLFARLSKDKI